MTRHLYNRPASLEHLKRSLVQQTVQDYEHIILTDDFGIGVTEANKMFWHHRDRPRGRYVYMIDDDDLLTDTTFVAELKRITVQENPDIIVFKFAWPGGEQAGYLPDDAYWRKPPARGHIHTCCFAVERQLWRKYIWAFGWHENGASVGRPGDYFFLAKIWETRKPRVHWHDKIVGELMRIGNGRPEPEETEA